MSSTIVCVNVNIMSDFSITYTNKSMLCQSECACLHKTVNMVVLKKSYTIVRKPMKMYRVLYETKRGHIKNVTMPKR